MNEELFKPYEPKTYGPEAAQAAFLLGGIGTGNISVGARGELRDFELFNAPGKGLNFPLTFFSIWAKPAGLEPVTRVIEAELQPPFALSHGFDYVAAAGLPRFRGSRMRGETPYVWVDMLDETYPVDVRLEGFTPFVPLDADASGYPVAVLRYTVSNPTCRRVDVSIAGSLANMCGFKRQTVHADGWKGIDLFSKGRNAYREGEGIKGVFFESEEDPLSVRYGNMCLVTLEPEVTATPNWLDGGWFDGLQGFWNDFSADGKLEAEPRYVQQGVTRDQSPYRVGSLAAGCSLNPGQEHTFTFAIAWYMPLRNAAWEQARCDGAGNCLSGATLPNYYGAQFTSSWDAAADLFRRLDMLEGQSRAFHDALYGSTLPGVAIEAASANITVLRSTTCFRLGDGTFQGWEGCHDSEGCCFGTCTHVWNYAQTLAFLFPELEQSMRRVEFGLETDDTGYMAFRSNRVVGKPAQQFHPAADGQLGAIVRLYREWKLSGDDGFLRDLWPGAVRALEYAFSYWDKDGDGVLDSQQHNTYDIEFYGPNSLVNSLFLAALKAAAEMAEHLGEGERAARYSQAFQAGSARMDQLLWNGEYYQQQIEDVNAYRFQYGQGCLSDQLMGQFLAHMAGLGYVLPQDHVRSAVRAVFDHNFRQTFRGHVNPQRTYALNDEQGLILCSWPRGGRPLIPFIYSDEVWTGIEYQVASHLIAEDLVEQGLTVVKAVRDRHDGIRRNPWNEVECGHHYARSMSSWGLIVALTGFSYDMAAGTVSFAPRVNAEQFQCFWSTGKAWGIYRQRRSEDGSWEKQLIPLFGSGVRLAASST